MKKLFLAIFILCSVAAFAQELGVAVANAGTVLAPPRYTWGGKWTLNFVNGGCVWNSGTHMIDCTIAGGGTISSGTTNRLPKYTAATTIGNSLLSDDGTALSYTGTGGASFSGTNGGLDLTEGTGAGLTAASSHCIVYGDSTAHALKWNCNNGTTFQVQSTAAPVTLATGTSVSLSAPAEVYVCTSTCTVTPPVPAAGYQFCALNGDNVTTVITMAALGSSSRYEVTARTSYGTAGTGTMVSGGAAKDMVCIVGLDSTHYITTNFIGTWTVN